MKILIGTPAYGGILHCDYVGSLLNTTVACAQAGIRAEIYFLKNESLVSRARNNCASYFLRSDADKLFFIDADQVWSPEDFLRVAQSDKSITGGTYAKKTLPIDLNFSPLPAVDHTYFPEGSRSIEAYQRFAELADDRGEIEVSELPTGFLCIKREVFEALKPGCPSYLQKDNQHAEEFRNWDFFPVGVFPNGNQYKSEDFYFCHQAREAGYPSYLSVRTIVGHIGPMTYSVPRSEVPK